MSQKSIRRTLRELPIIGYGLRIISNIVSLPKIHNEVDSNTQSLVRLQQEHYNNIKELDTKTTHLFDVLNDAMANLQIAQDSIREQYSRQKYSRPTPGQDKELFADDHMMDKFYTNFEDRFRGSEKMIIERQNEYLPLFKDSKLDFNKTPILDIGSGRGEFLQLLKRNELKAVGLDINLDMVERSKKKGLDAVQGDALGFLQDKKSQTYGAITGFHIVEHIPFNILMRIFQNSLRTLTKGGFVVFETPNPENLVVGSHNFYMDPSHLHPLPPVLLAFALETVGFTKVEIKRLHPDDDYKPNGLPEDVVKRLYGPRDYAVIGYK